MILPLLLAALARDEVADAIAKLRAAADSTARYQAGNALEAAAKPVHVGLLLKEADAGPAAIRPHLIFALAKLGTKEAVAGLRALAQKHDFSCRVEAAEQLLWLQDDLGLKVLVELLPKASTSDEKRQVLYSLRGAAGRPGEALPAVAKFLAAEKSADGRRQAVEFLGSCRDPEVAPILRPIAADPKDPVRFEALACLVRAGDDAAFEDALKALEGGAAAARDASHLLNAIEGTGKKSALPRLRELLEKSADKSLRGDLIRSLARLKDDASLGLLNKLIDDPDPSVSRAALDAVLKLAGRAQLDLLRKVAGDEDPVRRMDAAEALLQLDLREGFDALKTALESKTSYTRQKAVLILMKTPRRESVDLLLPLLEDADASIRGYARTGIQKALESLFPYLKFNKDAAPDKLRAWWEKNRPK